MTKHSSGGTINRGPAPPPDRGESGSVAGNARLKGEDPSPDDRERGETTSAEDCTAHDRAG
jgi:hypothetical protein